MSNEHEKVHDRNKMKELISILLESSFYLTIPLEERYALIRMIIEKHQFLSKKDAEQWWGVRGGIIMKNLKDSFREKFSKDIHIEIEQDYPTHISVEEMIEIVYEASEKIGMNSYIVLKHFQFTEEEIKGYVKKVRVSDA
jgi:hypothetical protein